MRFGYPTVGTGGGGDTYPGAGAYADRGFNSEPHHCAQPDSDSEPDRNSDCPSDSNLHTKPDCDSNTDRDTSGDPTDGRPRAVCNSGRPTDGCR